MSNMNLQLLLIGDAHAQWTLVLTEALESLGRLQVVSEKDALRNNTWIGCDVTIIDAGAVSDAVELVVRLREREPNVRVVVASAAPTWVLARAALMAGAADLIPKSLDRTELNRVIKELVEAPPPP